MRFALEGRKVIVFGATGRVGGNRLRNIGNTRSRYWGSL